MQDGGLTRQVDFLSLLTLHANRHIGAPKGDPCSTENPRDSLALAGFQEVSGRRKEGSELSNETSPRGGPEVRVHSSTWLNQKEPLC